MLKLNLKRKSKKLLKQHNTADTLPTAQWFMFHKHHDFRYFLDLPINIRFEDLPKVSDKQMESLQAAYFQIIYSMKHHDLKILSSYRNWLVSCLEIDANKLTNKHRNLTKLQPIRISYYNSMLALYKYLDSFDSDFEVIFKEYYIRDDWEAHYKKLYPKVDIPDFLPELVEKLNGFYHIKEYVNICLQITDILPYRNVLCSEVFYYQFVKDRELVTSDLSDFAKYLKESFRKLKIADLYFDASRELFDLNQMKSKPNEKSDFWQEITAVKSELQHNFDIWKTPLAEYLAKIERIRAKRDIEEKLNKPKKAKQTM